jgi:hypothetical protein
MTHPLPSLLACALLIVGLTAGSDAAEKPWPPEAGVPVTSWGKEITATSTVWPEYPRPQMVRERWLNLNGTWEYAVRAKALAAPAAYEATILVPFPPQSRLSRVEKSVDPHDRIWYRRTFTIPPAWSGQRLLLHFGAVDWECQVMLNGVVVGSHRGGYDAFTCDISSAIRASGEQELVVSAWNPVEGGQPRGKQSLHPGGIFYTPTTGIWQTVWLEPVPEAHLSGLTLVTDVDRGTLTLTAAAACRDGDGVAVVVTRGGTPIARGAGLPGSEIAMRIPDAQLWWPDRLPVLYEVTGDARAHRRLSRSMTRSPATAGMRTISLGPDRTGPHQPPAQQPSRSSSSDCSIRVSGRTASTPPRAMKRCASTWRPRRSSAAICCASISRSNRTGGTTGRIGSASWSGRTCRRPARWACATPGRDMLA